MESQSDILYSTKLDDLASMIDVSGSASIHFVK